jgi:hypothetical protein
MEPTQEQIKWFWEQCGFTWWETAEAWCFGKYEVSRELPPIDLNSLFKYAVPKLSQYSFYMNELPWVRVTAGVIKPPHGKYTGRENIYVIEDKDPALALFWAIYKAFGVSDEDNNI